MPVMSTEPAKPVAAGRPCPLCGKAATPDFRPFCSRGCRDRDLINWFGEDYRIPVGPGTEDDDDLPATPSADRNGDD